MRRIATKQPLRRVGIGSLTANEVGVAEAAVELGDVLALLNAFWLVIVAVRPVALEQPEPTEELEPATKLTAAH